MHSTAPVAIQALLHYTLLFVTSIMVGEEQYSELQREIDRLSKEVIACREEIRELRDRIGSGTYAAERPAFQHTQRQTSVFNKANLENFVGLKLIHFVGIIVLLIGLTIGVKYAIDVNLISPLLRIILTYLVSVALLLVSFRLRRQYIAFSLIMFSGAMASAYFTTFAAYQYYEMLAQPVAFIIMLLLTFFTVYNSLLYDRVEIANLGLVAAYAIPFFVAGNTGSLFALFTYILLINTAILYISYKRYWLSLIYLAFFSTWIIYLSAVVLKGVVNQFSPGHAYAFVYFALFLVAAVIFKINRKEELGTTDTFIILANSVFLYISVNYLYSNTYPLSTRTINLIFAIVYVLGAFAVRKRLPAQPHLINALFAIALTTFVVYLGLAFSGVAVTIAWVVLAVALFVTGLWVKLKVFRVAAMLIFTVTLVKLLFVDSAHFSSVEKIIAYLFTGTVILIVSFLYQKFGKLIFNEEE